MHQSIFSSFKVAFEGILYALRQNRNMRIQFVVAIIVVLASLFFRVNPYQMGILAVVILLVIVTEMINTSFEEMIDLITIEHRKEAKAAKDVAAGMVLVAAIGSVIVGILIFTPYILRFLQ